MRGQHHQNIHDDNGNIIGVNNYKKLMEDIPNKSVNHLGLVIDVNLHAAEGKNYLEIIVPISNVPIAYHGVYHYRSGSTKQELKGIALQNLLLNKMGKKWKVMAVEGITFSDLNGNSIQAFIIKAIEKDRIPPNTLNIGKQTYSKSLKILVFQIFLVGP